MKSMTLFEFKCGYTTFKNPVPICLEKISLQSDKNERPVHTLKIVLENHTLKLIENDEDGDLQSFDVRLAYIEGQDDFELNLFVEKIKKTINKIMHGYPLKHDIIASEELKQRLLELYQPGPIPSSSDYYSEHVL